MRYAFFLLLCFAAPAMFAAADAPADSLRATLTEYSACWESRNKNACMDRFLAPDYTRINRNGQLGNAVTLRAVLQRAESAGRSGGWTFEAAKIQVHGDTALVTQSVSMPLGGGASNGAPVEHHQTMVWIRTGSGWKVVREHISYQVPTAPERR